MKKEVSSEEKLLNLIRKKNPGQKKEPKPKAIQAEASTPSPSRERFTDPSGLLMKGLAVLSLALLVYIGGNRFFVKQPPQIAMLPESQEEKVAQDGEQILTEPKPFDVYAETLNRRDIFASPFQRAVVESQPGALIEAAPASAAFDLSQNYKVVGIMVDKDPKVVVEDIRNQRTLFLSSGDELEGGKLQEIRDGKAIFLFNGQQVELMP